MLLPIEHFRGEKFRSSLIKLSEHLEVVGRHQRARKAVHAVSRSRSGSRGSRPVADVVSKHCEDERVAPSSLQEQKRYILLRSWQ